MDALVTVDEKGERIRITSDAELQSTFLRAANDARARGLLNVAFVEVPAGHIMGVVVGGDESALSFTSDHQDPPYLESRGVETGIKPVLTCYVSYVHHTELPRYRVIPYTLALKAVQEFAATGVLPGCVQWVET